MGLATSSTVNVSLIQGDSPPLRGGGLWIKGAKVRSEGDDRKRERERERDAEREDRQVVAT